MCRIRVFFFIGFVEITKFNIRSLPMNISSWRPLIFIVCQAAEPLSRSRVGDMYSNWIIDWQVKRHIEGSKSCVSRAVPQIKGSYQVLALFYYHSWKCILKPLMSKLDAEAKSCSRQESQAGNRAKVWVTAAQTKKVCWTNTSAISQKYHAQHTTTMECWLGPFEQRCLYSGCAGGTVHGVCQRLVPVQFTCTRSCQSCFINTCILEWYRYMTAC
jgi:hypothetical protein